MENEEHGHYKDSDVLLIMELTSILGSLSSEKLEGGAGGAPQIKKKVIRQSKFNRNDSPSCWQLWCLHTAKEAKLL